MGQKREHLKSIKHGAGLDDVGATIEDRGVYGRITAAMEIDPLAAIDCGGEHVVQCPQGRSVSIAHIGRPATVVGVAFVRAISQGQARRSGSGGDSAHRSRQARIRWQEQSHGCVWRFTIPAIIMLRHHRNDPGLGAGKWNRVPRSVIGGHRTSERPTVAPVGDGPAGNRIGDRGSQRLPLREELGISIGAGANAIVDILIHFIANLEAKQAGPQRIGGISRFGGAIRGRVHGHIDAIDDVPVAARP